MAHLEMFAIDMVEAQVLNLGLILKRCLIVMKSVASIKRRKFLQVFQSFVIFCLVS